MPAAPRRKLIEVALPLETINREAAREKSIRHGHPSTLHLWWARRPLAAARAVLFAQLVDDPSSHPDKFPDEESVQLERKRLHDIIKRLVEWENSNDADLLAEAHAEILRSTDGNPPPILDPFCGGGTIPLEAQRLGLEAHASDLNPVAVLITKALIEIPPKFADRPPVFPGLADAEIRTWRGAQGLAADVRAYGEWMRDEAAKRIGHLYPKATLADGSSANVIAWIWARTVICPNPACGIEMPLVRSWWLGKKKGKEAYVEPYLVDDPAAPGKRRVEFAIEHDPARAPSPETDGTMSGRKGAVCVACQTAVPVDHIRTEAVAGRMGATLLATVAEGVRQRLYLAPTDYQSSAKMIDRPRGLPEGDIADNPRWFSPPAYGLTRFADLFTPRQLIALTTFSDLVGEARERAYADARAAGLPDGERLEAGGTGAAAYADAVATYLGLTQSKLTNLASSITTWMSDRGALRETFARQALPMAWDFAESNVLGPSGGGWLTVLDKVERSIEVLPTGIGSARQCDALTVSLNSGVLSTDPPYYDNIGYSDLSDFFYVWLRRSLKQIHPRLLSTLLVPKTDELVANPYRHNGRDGAREFFEQGFERFFERANMKATGGVPITAYYAFKQTESHYGGTSSTGWETILSGMLTTGWMITGTWPVRTEGSGRLLAKDTNALASSVVLALRPRPDDAPTTDRRGFLAALTKELPAALRELEQGNIAPVDLPQAVIGPGMAIYSRYARVLADDGSQLSVRSALATINEVLGEIHTEQEGDFDPTTRFALAWFRQHGYAPGAFGDADNLARSRSTAVEAIARTGILTSHAGKVALLRPTKLPPTYDPVADTDISQWEVLHHLVRLMDTGGADAAGAFLARAQSRPDPVVDADLVKELTFLLFDICERKSWSREAITFNGIATAWPDIVEAARRTPVGVQSEFAYEAAAEIEAHDAS